jgi:cell division protein YceG involved in septum cleavage
MDSIFLLFFSVVARGGGEEVFQETFKKHSRNIQETFKKHSRNIQEHSRNIQETFKKNSQTQRTQIELRSYERMLGMF